MSATMTIIPPVNGNGHQASKSLGIPLDDRVLEAMPAEERAFFESFLDLAKVEARVAPYRGEELPYYPSALFARKYREAVEEWNGRRFTQVRNLERIFVF